MTRMNIKDTTVTVVNIGEEDYISLTDLAKSKSVDPTATINVWMCSRNTLEYLGLWEKLHNPNFKATVFEEFIGQAEMNAFTMSPKKWIEGVNAIGLIFKSGRSAGTYAHPDIAFKFACWISVDYELYLIKEFQQLKQKECSYGGIGWSVKKELDKINTINPNYIMVTHSLENENRTQVTDPLIWGEPLPQAILDLLPQEKIDILENYIDYRVEKEKKLRDAYQTYLHDLASFLLTQKVEKELDIAKGKRLGAFKVANRLLANECDLALIEEATDFTPEEINKIKNGELTQEDFM